MLPNAKRHREAIENSIQLEDYVNFSHIGNGVGAALLSNGKDYQFKFGFKVTYLSPTASSEQYANTVECIMDGIKAMPNGETITVIHAVKPDNSTRLQYFSQLAQGAPNRLFSEMVRSAASPSEYFLNLNSEKKRELARQKYKRKELRIYVTATSSQDASTRDKTEAFVKGAINLAAKAIAAVSGSVERDHSPQEIKRLFVNAQFIYEAWCNVMGKMRLGIQPMTVEDLIADQWEAFNPTPPQPPPQLLTWDGEQIHYQATDDLHVSSWLFQDQLSVPRAARNYVKQSFSNGEDRLTGVVSLRNKPGAWRDRKALLTYLYDKTEGLEDFKVVLSATKAPASLVKRNIELLQRQAKDAQRAGERKGLPTNFSQRLEEAASKAEHAIYEGDIPIKLSLCFLVSKPTKKALEMACRQLQSRFTLPATLEIEQDYTYTTWLQCFPQLTYASPLFKPYNRTRGYKTSCVPAFMPIVGTISPDEKGLEFITEGELTPYYLDIADVHRHMLFLAITRAGKSVLFAQILLLAMCSNIPMVVVDYPKENGDSTFGPITQLAGEYGAYLNIAEESNNFLEPPNLQGFEKEEKARRLIEVKDYVLDILMIIMFGPSDSNMDREKRVAKSIFGNMLMHFYADPRIKHRFELAADAPMGSPDWQNVPTLKDFSRLCTPEILKQVLDTDEINAEHIRLVNEMRLRFESFMSTTVGRSMSSPTSIPADAKLLVFAFKGVSNNDDAAILMASASAAAMRRTLSAPVSILFMDEASILSKFDALMYQAAKIAANGAKSGIRLMMALQTPASINNSQYGAEIISNMATRVIGRIDEADAKNYCDILDLPPDVISVNTSKSFYPNIQELYSRWLIVDRGERTFVRSYAPPLLLAAVANNPDEEAAKRAFLAAYPDEPVLALKAFAKELILAAQQARPMVLPQVSGNASPKHIRERHIKEQERHYVTAS